MNVFDFAMRMEEESWKFYDGLAASAKTKELRTIFILLADSEREHHEHLTLLKAGTDPALAQSVVLDKAREHIHELVGTVMPSDVLHTDFDAYRHAIKEEEQSIKLYEKLADQEPNRDAADLLRLIAAEERQHLEVIENIYDFVEGPRTYLEWGEFSNLKQY